MTKHRPVEEIVADRDAAAERLNAAQADLNRFGDELRALKATIDAAMKPYAVTR